jgi:hypothetical protein
VGRHSLEDERVFWRSVMFFVLKWMGVVALPLLAVWGIWRLVRQPDQKAVAPAVQTQRSPSPSPAPSPSPSPTKAAASPTPAPSPTASPTGAAKGQIQVLNGTGTAGLARRAADKLTAAGYEVVIVQNASRRYDATTIFFKPGFEEQAREVGRVLGSTNVEAAPSSLQRDIPVTAVVGPDYQD